LIPVCESACYFSPDEGDTEIRKPTATTDVSTAHHSDADTDDDTESDGENPSDADDDDGVLLDLADSSSNRDLSLTEAGSVDGKSQECNTQLLLPSSNLLTRCSGPSGNFTIFDRHLLMVSIAIKSLWHCYSRS